MGEESNDGRRLAVVSSRADRDAGQFTPWLRATRRALEGGGGSEVPCGSCRGCCEASMFVHVAPDELDTLDAIPDELLFAAPGLPRGHRVLGYDEHGRCPMMGDAGCTIYEDRPRTCRSYDCRVLAATELVLEGEEQAPVSETVLRWRFSYASASDEQTHRTLVAAARFLLTHPQLLPEGIAGNATQTALLAIKVHDVFLKHAQSPPEAVVAEAIARATARPT